jgi:hypothetical protein
MLKILGFILIVNLEIFFLVCFIYGTHLTDKYWSGSKKERMGNILTYVGLLGIMISYAIAKIFSCILDGNCC